MCIIYFDNTNNHKIDEKISYITYLTVKNVEDSFEIKFKGQIKVVGR